VLLRESRGGGGINRKPMQLLVVVVVAPWMDECAMLCNAAKQVRCTLNVPYRQSKVIHADNDFIVEIMTIGYDSTQPRFFVSPL
jgi:hypothetical protein